MSIFALAAVAAQFIGSPPALAPPPSGAVRATLTEFLTLTVSPEGRVIGCAARLDTGAPVDDADNCARMRRAAMRPARDDAGVAMFGVVTVRQGWGGQRPDSLPAEMYVKLAQLPSGVDAAAVAALTLVVGPDGRTESCAVARSSGNDTLDRVACRAVSDGGFAVSTDTGGPASRYVRPLLVGFVQGVR